MGAGWTQTGMARTEFHSPGQSGIGPAFGRLAPGQTIIDAMRLAFSPLRDHKSPTRHMLRFNFPRTTYSLAKCNTSSKLCASGMC